VIKKAEKDPAIYDVVAIGTPVCATKMSTPVRTIFSRKYRFRKVAFFLTGDGTGSEKVFAYMAEVPGRPPVATLALTKRGSDDWPVQFKGWQIR
jgi:hypothetical protein